MNELNPDKPICYDLFCGLGGWAEGFLAEGYDVIGFDIEAHDYGTGGYPGKLILRDVRSIHGSELRDAAVIVASPPCQAYSYRAMPWKRAKELPPPDNTLFNECFRIQREASEAAGRYIPLIVENVRGAQKWVGRARWNYGSFYLWGDVPALMPITFKAFKSSGMNWSDQSKRGQDFTRIAGNQALEAAGMKVGNAASRTFQERRDLAAKHPDLDPHNWWHSKEGTKSIKIDGTYAERKARGDISCLYSHRSQSRKLASAMIAKIPFPLARHIAACYRPEEAHA